MKLIIGVITGIVILYPFVELVYVIKTKRYCEAYSNTVGMIMRIILYFRGLFISEFIKTQSIKNING